MTIKAGCRLSTLYVNGITITMLEGGAERDRRASRLTKEASRVAGRWLHGRIRRHGQYEEDDDTGNFNIRRRQEKFGQTEETCTVFEVKEVFVKKRVKPRIERWIIAERPRANDGQ